MGHGLVVSKANSTDKMDTSNRNNSFLEEEPISGLHGRVTQSLGRRNRETWVQVPQVPLMSCDLGNLLTLQSCLLLNVPGGRICVRVKCENLS